MTAEWISVDERLPAEEVVVLVFDEGWIGTASYYDEVFWDDSAVVPVTHWMSLPEPPDAAKRIGGAEQ